MEQQAARTNWPRFTRLLLSDTVRAGWASLLLVGGVGGIAGFDQAATAAWGDLVAGIATPAYIVALLSAVFMMVWPIYAGVFRSWRRPHDLAARETAAEDIRA